MSGGRAVADPGHRQATVRLPSSHQAKLFVTTINSFEVICQPPTQSGVRPHRKVAAQPFHVCSFLPHSFPPAPAPPGFLQVVFSSDDAVQATGFTMNYTATSSAQQFIPTCNALAGQLLVLVSCGFSTV